MMMMCPSGSPHTSHPAERTAPPLSISTLCDKLPYPPFVKNLESPVSQSPETPLADSEHCLGKTPSHDFWKTYPGLTEAADENCRTLWEFAACKDESQYRVRNRSIKLPFRVLQTCCDEDLLTVVFPNLHFESIPAMMYRGPFPDHEAAVEYCEKNPQWHTFSIAVPLPRCFYRHQFVCMALPDYKVPEKDPKLCLIYDAPPKDTAPHNLAFFPPVSEDKNVELYAWMDLK